MSNTAIVSIRPRDHVAVPFHRERDVLTRTAAVHAAAWKRLFDAFPQRTQPWGEAFVCFDAGADDRRHVDGKPVDLRAATAHRPGQIRTGAGPRVTGHVREEARR